MVPRNVYRSVQAQNATCHSGTPHMITALKRPHQPRHALTLRTAQGEFTIAVSQRDLGVLRGPLVPEGLAFWLETGATTVYRVATGLDSTTWVARDARALLTATTAALQRLTTDAELLSFDYAYALLGNRNQRSSVYGITLNGKAASLHCRTPGHIYFRLDQHGQPPVLIDLRGLNQVQTDHWGAVTIQQRAAPAPAWPGVLPVWVGALLAGDGTVHVRHGLIPYARGKTPRD